RDLTNRAGLSVVAALAFLPPAVADQPGLDRALVEAVETLSLIGREQLGVRDVQEVLGDEPDVLLARHPVAPVEATQVHRLRERPQRSRAGEIEVLLEVAERELPQRAIDRLAISEEGVVRLSDRAPSIAVPIDRDDVVGVVLRLEVEDQRRVAV